MSIEIKRRRGTTAQHAAFVGKEAELTVDTDKHTVVVHDGVTPGGHPLAHATDVGTAIDEALGALTAADVPTTNGGTVQEKLDGVASQLAAKAQQLHLTEKTGHGVVSGLSVSAQVIQDMTVQVQAGVAYAADGTRRETAEDVTVEIASTDPTSPRKDIVYIDGTGAVAYLAGQPLSSAVPGARQITITENAVVGDVVTFLDVTLTAEAESPVGENGFLIGETIADTAFNLAGFLDGHLTIQSPYVVTAVDDKILITEKVPGDGNNPPEITVTGTMANTQEVLSVSTPAVETVEPPALPEGGILLAQINVPVEATEIAPGNIADMRRAILDMPYTDADGQETTVTTRLKTHDASLQTQGEAIAENTSQLAANTTKISNITKTVGILTNSVDGFAAMQQLVKDGYGPLAFPVGTQIRTPHTEYGGGNIVWVVVAHNHHKNPSDLSAPTTTLLMRDVIYGRQFDAIEALYYCETELPAGAYYFTLLAEHDTAYGGGKTLQFTTTQPVPAGGVIMFPWGYQVQSTNTKISTYPTRESAVAIESNISVVEGAGGTNLGTANGLTPNMNHAHRIRYGSNNYAESAIRQWIKSAAAANAWWTPQTIFDRSPTYANVAGFLNGLDPEFVAILGAPEIVTARNTIYEIGGTTGGSYTTNDLIFLPSITELGLGKNNNIDEGALLEYYDGAVNADRIKYDIADQTTARYWWVRSPNPSYAYHVRRVGTDGSLYSNGADYGYGAVAACVIM